MQHVGIAPKTMKVKSKDHDGQTVVINAADFDPEIHEKEAPPKPKIDPDAAEKLDDDSDGSK